MTSWNWKTGAALCALLALPAAAAPAGYHVVTSFTLGGDGGWDYINRDPASGNLFITRAILEALPRPHFDPAFALTGGEDREFFVRLAGLGARFAWADKARAHGEVPQSRQDMRWLLARAYSTGNSDMRVLMKHRPGPVMWLGESVKIAGAVLLSLPLAVILAFSPNHRLKPLALLCRNAGKLTAMMGRRYNEYAMVHGE